MSEAPGAPGLSPTWSSSNNRAGTRWIGRDFRVQVVPRAPQSG